MKIREHILDGIPIFKCEKNNTRHGHNVEERNASIGSWIFNGELVRHCYATALGLFLFALVASSNVCAAKTSRTPLSLNGVWQIADSEDAAEIPSTYNHTVPVPGLVNLSKPAFSDVDMFASWACLSRHGRKYPWDGKTVTGTIPKAGLPFQKRNYFWYRTHFKVPEKRDVVLLQIGKSQFGTKVYLNGKAVGEHLSCWTASSFNLTGAVDWAGENELLVRIGAHPAVLPANIPGAGTCSSKFKWTPGIYDDVKLVFCNNPVIETIQIAPRLSSSEVIVQTKVKNYDSKARDFALGHTIRTWKEHREVARIPDQQERIEGGQEKTFTQTVRMTDPHLWFPEDPFLYELDSSTGGDSQKTRFGMREFRFDNEKGVGYLNGKPYYLRGGNIELHLHFEDPLCGNRPWDRAWVKKLLADIPKKMNWNAFRFSMSPVPQMWLDIADEEGILVQLEPLLWKHGEQWEVKEVIAEFGRWMRDNWNHPSVFMWDSSNETNWKPLIDIVNAVRPLDISNRGWDNSWTPPAGPDDPYESHPYMHQGKGCDYRQIQGKASQSEKVTAGRCRIINEYDWLWLYPDGEPLELTTKLYPKAVPNGTAEERREYRWYMTAGLTEYWRAKDHSMGIMYYQYLGSYLARPAPGPYHFGVFADVVNLQLQPEFEKYMLDAFKPLGVYIDFWGDGKAGTEQGTIWSPLKAGENHPFSIVMVNDYLEPVEGKLSLSLENEQGIAVETREMRFRVEGAGKAVFKMDIAIPEFNSLIDNKYTLKAVASPDGTHHKGATTSCRKVLVEEAVETTNPAIQK